MKLWVIGLRRADSGKRRSDGDRLWLRFKKRFRVRKVSIRIKGENLGALPRTPRGSHAPSTRGCCLRPYAECVVPIHVMGVGLSLVDGFLRVGVKGLSVSFQVMMDGVESMSASMQNEYSA